MRIVVVGAGVIGSVYGDRLARSGHDVVLLARGQRLADLQAHGLLLEDAVSRERTEAPLPVVSELSRGDRYDLALVPVRCDQVAGTPPVLLDMEDRPDVLFSATRPDSNPSLRARSASERSSASPRSAASGTGRPSGTC